MVLTKNSALTDESAEQRLFSAFKMTKERVQMNVETVRQWMRKQPYLPTIPPELDDETDYWIENLLRLTKNDVEKVKLAVDAYYKGMPIFGDLRDIPDFRKYVYSDVFDNNYMMLLPNLTPDGSKIMLYGMTTDNVPLFQLKDFLRRKTMMLDLQLKNGVDFTGLIIIVYARHGSLGHIAQFDLKYLKNFFKYGRRAYPLRLKHTHIIYPPSLIETVIKILRPFIPKKIMSRITVHKDLDSLRETIPKENLPADFGGTLPTLDELHEDWRQRLIENYEWLKDRRSKTTDETKRPKKDSKMYKTLNYEINGSFKTFAVD